MLQYTIGWARKVDYRRQKHCEHCGIKPDDPKVYLVGLHLGNDCFQRSWSRCVEFRIQSAFSIQPEISLTNILWRFKQKSESLSWTLTFSYKIFQIYHTPLSVDGRLTTFERLWCPEIYRTRRRQTTLGLRNIKNWFSVVFVFENVTSTDIFPVNLLCNAVM